MVDLLYLIQLCPRALRPAVGDRISVRMAAGDPGQPLSTEIHLPSGVALSCVRMTMDTAGRLVPFPLQPITGTVSDVRSAPAAGGKMGRVPAFVTTGLLPEDVLISVRSD